MRVLKSSVSQTLKASRHSVYQLTQGRVLTVEVAVRVTLSITFKLLNSADLVTPTAPII